VHPAKGMAAELGWQAMTYVVLASQLAVAGVLLLSLLSKVRSRRAYEEFAASLAGLGALPRGWVPAAAVGTVVAEACATLLLVLSMSTAPVGFGLAGGLLSIFGAAMVVAMRRGSRVPCRCFGASITPIGPAHIIRNLLLLGACVIGFVGSARDVAPMHDMVGVTISLAAAAVAVLLVRRLDDVVALFGTSRRVHARE
jgi:hypothetical protein